MFEGLNLSVASQQTVMYIDDIMRFYFCATDRV